MLQYEAEMLSYHVKLCFCTPIASLSEDDTTILLLQATGTRSRFVDNLRTPLRLLRGVTDATDIAQP